MFKIGDLDLSLFCTCLLAWVTVYYLLFYLFPTRGAEWQCRTITVSHALVISFMAGWCCFIQGPWPLTDAGGPNTQLQIVTATICLSYFIFDFSWCLYYQTEGFTMLLHHFLSIIGLLVTLLVGKYGTELVATICGGEITNPLLQLRWFLRETGHKNSLAAEVVDWMFVCSFGFMRLGIGTILLYGYFMQPTDNLGRFGAICIYSLGVIFWVNIMQFAFKKYSGNNRKKRASANKSEGEVTTNGLNGVKSQKTLNSEYINSIPSQGELKRANGCLNFDKKHLVYRKQNGVVKQDGL
ncbi:hypothetical protein SNE40_017131 [Patella caerulea]|uniref:TLC domain-containing protein n=1 Tax=Patella caerulea TaxID=87958 RepID=A0AAN8JBD0_PATCE